MNTSIPFHKRLKKAGKAIIKIYNSLLHKDNLQPFPEYMLKASGAVRKAAKALLPQLDNDRTGLRSNVIFRHSSFSNVKIGFVLEKFPSKDSGADHLRLEVTIGKVGATTAIICHGNRDIIRNYVSGIAKDPAPLTERLKKIYIGMIEYGEPDREW